VRVYGDSRKGGREEPKKRKKREVASHFPLFSFRRGARKGKAKKKKVSRDGSHSIILSHRKEVWKRFHCIEKTSGKKKGLTYSSLIFLFGCARKKKKKELLKRKEGTGSYSAVLSHLHYPPHRPVPRKRGKRPHRHRVETRLRLVCPTKVLSGPFSSQIPQRFRRKGEGGREGEGESVDQTFRVRSAGVSVMSLRAQRGRGGGRKPGTNGSRASIGKPVLQFTFMHSSLIEYQDKAERGGGEGGGRGKKGRGEKETRSRGSRAASPLFSYPRYGVLYK